MTRDHGLDWASSGAELALVLCGTALVSLSLAIANGPALLVQVLIGLGLLWAAASARYWRRSAREWEQLYRWGMNLDKAGRPVPGVVIPPDDHVL